eukprot:1963959-Ditylum_brightwellii.AAC.1
MDIEIFDDSHRKAYASIEINHFHSEELLEERITSDGFSFTEHPSDVPTNQPTDDPTPLPTPLPTNIPTDAPSALITPSPT